MPTLASNLDELLRTYPPNEAWVERYPSRYDILFRKGNAQLLVSVFFESRSYEVGGNAPVAARTKDDVWAAAALFTRVQAFLSALNSLDVRDSRQVIEAMAAEIEKNARS